MILTPKMGIKPVWSGVTFHTNGENKALPRLQIPLDVLDTFHNDP